jgi:hypothetical protein
VADVIIKCHRDHDLYVIWVTGPGGPGWVGTRFDMKDLLTGEWQRDHPHCIPKAGYSPEDRLRRADQHGSENTAAHGYGWDAPGFIVDQRWLPRHSLLAYAQALRADDEKAAEALLQPLGED